MAVDIVTISSAIAVPLIAAAIPILPAIKNVGRRSKVLRTINHLTETLERTANVEGFELDRMRLQRALRINGSILASIEERAAGTAPLLLQDRRARISYLICGGIAVFSCIVAAVRVFNGEIEDAIANYVLALLILVGSGYYQRSRSYLVDRTIALQAHQFPVEWFSDGHESCVSIQREGDWAGLLYRTKRITLQRRLYSPYVAMPDATDLSDLFGSDGFSTDAMPMPGRKAEPPHQDSEGYQAALEAATDGHDEMAPTAEPTDGAISQV
jgi:hypothetical protein